METNKIEEFLNRLFESTTLRSQSELARTLGIHRSAITQAKRKNAVPEKWALKLARMFDLNPTWLFSGKGQKRMSDHFIKDMGFIRIAKVKARLCAGSGSFETGDDIEAYHLFPSSWLRSKGCSDQMVLMDIFGASMEPEIKDGDTILVDQSQKDILAGAVYAVGIDDTIMVKRLEKRPGKLALISENPKYDPILLAGREMNKIRIIGRVVWICRELF